MSKKAPSPNDQRSNAKNPNNPAYAADLANRASTGTAVPPVNAPPWSPTSEPKK